MICKMFRNLQEMNLEKAFEDLRESTDMIKIFTNDDDASLTNRDLMRFSSPLIKNILKDIPCCSSYMICIPDVSKSALDSVLDLIAKGFSDFKSNSTNYIKEIQEASALLGIDLNNLQYFVNKAQVDIDEVKNMIKQECLKGDETGSFKEGIGIHNELDEPKNEPIHEYFELSDASDDFNVKLEPLFYPNIKCEKKDLEQIESLLIQEPKNFHIVAPTPPPEPHSIHLLTPRPQLIPSSSACTPIARLNEGEKEGIKSIMEIEEKKFDPNKKQLEKSINTSLLTSSEPISSLPELQYVYEMSYHRKCGGKHRRIDLCPSETVHAQCGNRHSPTMECDGSWMTMKKFEMRAARWVRWVDVEEREVRDNISKDRNAELKRADGERLSKNVNTTIKRKRCYKKNTLSSNKLARTDVLENGFDELSKECPFGKPTQQVNDNDSNDINSNIENVKYVHEGEKVDVEVPTHLINWAAKMENLPLPGPPRSSRPELQYIYEVFFHHKCGEQHRRVDLCPAATPHPACGQIHSFVQSCDGLWQTLSVVESIAAGFASTSQQHLKCNHCEFEARNLDGLKKHTKAKHSLHFD